MASQLQLAENALGQEDFLQTCHNGNKFNFIGQLFTTTKEDDHVVHEGSSN